MTEPDEHAGIPRRGRRRRGRRPARARTSATGRWSAGWSWRSRSSARRATRDPLDHATSRTRSTRTARARVALANSTGFAASYEQTQCYAYAYAFAGEGARPHDRPGRRRRRAARTALDPEAIGHEAADRALALHGARQPQSRRCPVVLDPYVAASFASMIGGTLSADAVQRGRSLFAGKEGEQIAAPAPAAGRRRPRTRRGSRRRRSTARGCRSSGPPLIEDGMLRTYLFDAYTAPAAGRELDRQRRRAAPTARRRRSARPTCSSTPGERERRRSCSRRPATAST